MTLKPVNCINSALVIRNDYCGAIFLIKILIKIVAVLSLFFRGEGNQFQNGNFWINFKYRCNRITKRKKKRPIDIKILPMRTALKMLTVL